MASKTSDGQAGETTLGELFARATAEHDAERVEPALEIYLRILEMAPRHVATLIHVADVYRRFGREADAGMVVSHLIARDEAALIGGVRGLASANLGFARLCLDAGRAALADRILARALELWPGDSSLNLAVGERLAQDGDRDGAEAYFRHAAALAPERAEPWLKLADLQAARGDDAALLEALLRALELAPGAGEAIRRAIAASQRLGDGELAAHFLERLTPLIEGDGEALSYIGFRMLAARRFEAALAAFARAADLDLEGHEALIGAGTAAHALGEAQAAREYWSQGLALVPPRLDAWLALSRTFAPDLPREMLRRLIDGAARQAGRDVDALCQAAEAACEVSLHEAAGEIVGRALALAPRNLRAGRLREALARFQRG